MQQKLLEKFYNEVIERRWTKLLFNWSGNLMVKGGKFQKSRPKSNMAATVYIREEMAGIISQLR